MDDSGTGEGVSALADAVAAADRTVALTGAGVSTASGIPAFRGEGGLWERHDPADFTIEAFERDPAGFWEGWLGFHESALSGEVTPNAAHDALAGMEAEGHLTAVLTQNVDGLHRAAGSGTVLALHGRADRASCRTCGEAVPMDAAMAAVRDGESPPRCGSCGGVRKPDTVLFGERLPQRTLARARAHANESDVLVAAGTSLTVEPAASLPRLAGRAGATVAVVNDEPTDVDPRADHVLRGDVTEVLPALREAVASREAPSG